MKILALLFLAPFVAQAQEAVVYPVLPDGSRDYRGPNYAISGNRIYQTMPDGSRDYRKPVYVISGERVHKALPDGSRDYRAEPRSRSISATLQRR